MLERRGDSSPEKYPLSVVTVNMHRSPLYLQFREGVKAVDVTCK